jgi:hypothetical protein
VKRKATRIIIIVTTLGLAGFGILQTLPLLIDQDKLRLSIEDGLHKSTGVHFRIEELQIEPTLFHGLQVHLNTSTITDLKHHPLGSIRNITVAIRYLPLLTEQTPEIAKIHLNHVRIPVGKYNLFKEIHLKLVKPEQTGFLKPAEMKDTEVLLTDYLIEDVQIDPTVQVMYPRAGQFRVEGHELSIRHLESQKPISLLGNGLFTYSLLAAPKSNLANAKPPAVIPKKFSLSGYRMMMEMPQEAVKKGTLTGEGLGRLELVMKGNGLNLNLTYRHQDKQGGIGSINSQGLDLKRGQAVALQLGDTFGVPMPAELSRYLLTGHTNVQNRFKVSFLQGQPKITGMVGHIQLMDILASQLNIWPRPLAHHINGQLLLNGKDVAMKGLSFQIQNLPFSLQGHYNLDTEAIDAILVGRHLQITSLRQMLANLSNSSDPLQGRNLGGLLDIYAHITGTASQPSYKGLITVQNGQFEDATQGLLANGITGRIRFNGAGLQQPTLAYDGTLTVNDGKLISAKQGIQVNQFNGQLAFNGKLLAGSTTPTLPAYSGVIQVKDAAYHDPKTGLPIEGIHGVLRLLSNNIIKLENFHGILGGSDFLAQGTVSPNLQNPAASQYDVHLTGDRINLRQFKTDVLTKLPNAKPILAQLDPYSGQAKLDLTVSTGLQLHGRLDINDLAIQTAQGGGTPLQIPQISLLFDNKQIKVPETTIYYGTIALNLNGEVEQPGQYRFQVASNDIPVSFLRDQSALLSSLSGTTLPEIWNTEGAFALHGIVSNHANDFVLDLQNAGLSWRGADFPLYDMNGSISYKQAGKQKPLISSQNLTLRYGNSPVALSINNQSHLDVQASGILSALTVNHFLVSRQTNATPYREIPFQAAATGMLVGLPDAKHPAPKNDIHADMHLDLNRNLKEGYTAAAQNPHPTLPEHPFAASSTLQNVEHSLSSVVSLNPIRTVGNILGLAKNTVQAGVSALTPNNAPEEPAKTEPLPSPKAEVAPAMEPSTHLALANAATNADAYLNTSLHWVGPDLDIDRAELNLFDSGALVANGRLENLFAPDHQAFLVHLVSSPGLDLAKLSAGTGDNAFFKGASGLITTDLHIAGTNTGAKLASGWLTTNQVSLPYLTLEDLTGKITLDGKTGLADVTSFKVPGVSLNFSAQTDNIFDVPITLEDVKIRGDLLSIDSLSSFNTTIVQPILVDQVAHSFLRPWQQGDPTSPIQFRDADLQVNEVIFQNILLNNLHSAFSLYANSFFELTNTQLEAAGGVANGYLSMSPNDDNFMTLELNVNNVKANALTKALLNVTNQVFGDLSGSVRFTTYGSDDIAMQKNANGTVSMKITNGRLPAIAKVETLLTTANIIRGGLLGLNLNNLFRSLTIYDTNYFATLSGDMLINNQVLYTQNLISDGVNLDLLIQGSMQMDNGNANMLVNGRMSQDVAGKFGAIGKLSLGGLVKFIPGIGNFGKNQTGLLGYIPGVGYVPGFGGPAGEVNRFQVRLVGPLDDPASIKNFHWVKAGNL